MAYKDIIPVGTSLVVGATCFGLGVVYAQLPYDLNILWRNDGTGTAFERSLANYRQWALAPRYVHHMLHGVMCCGLAGCFIKLYKPRAESTYFEYGTLGLFMVAIIIYLTNLRTGVNACVTGAWGDVDEPTGLSVMGALLVMIVIVLLGVLVLQGGLYYAQWLDDKLQREFYEREYAQGKDQEQEKEQGKEKTKEQEKEQEKGQGEPESATATSSKKKKSNAAKKRKD